MLTKYKIQSDIEQNYNTQMYDLYYTWSRMVL